MHEGHRERMRDRYLQNGIGAFAPHEVLEMLLFFTKPRVNTNGTAHKLMETFGSFNGILDADYNALCNVEGIGPNSAFFLCLLKDCVNLYTKSLWDKKPQLINYLTSGTYIHDMIGNQSTEGFYVVSLDASRNILGFDKIAYGTAYRTYIDVRLVVETALTRRAHCIILAHNHPTGMLSPSESDIQLTKKLQKAFAELDISVIDHIIVGETGFFSMAEHMMM